MPHSDTTESHTSISFLPHFEAAMGAVREAFTELLASVGADSSTPIEISRTFGLNRNLAWKLTRVVNSVDLVEAVQHVPRRSGMQIALKCFAAHGASEHALTHVREAGEQFEEMVAAHAAGRDELELMVGSMLPHRVDPLLLESSRKSAFQGQSATWGVQAKTRFAAQIVASNAKNKDHVDIAVVSGSTGFRRLRPVTRWPLITSNTWGTSDPNYQPLDHSVAADSPPFLHDFCTPNAPDVEVRNENESRIHELTSGPVGNTAAFTYAFGYLSRDVASIRATTAGEVAEHSVTCDTPAERLVFDLLLHADLPIVADPKFCMCHAMLKCTPLSDDESYHLPSLGEVQLLGTNPPQVATPHVPRHREMLSLAAERLGRPLDEFRGYRVTILYPPVPTRGAFYYPLA
jgi:hypothetical protein